MGAVRDALKASRKKVVTRDQFHQARKNLKKAVKNAKKTVQSKMKSIAQYVQKSVRNSIKRGGKTTQKGAELWIYDSEGKRLCTVEEYLKGAYRAFGSGKYEAKAWYHENRNIKTGRLSKKNQKRGTYIIKGTGKFSSHERENIQDVRDRDITERKLIREIRKREKKRARFLRQSKYKSWTETQRNQAVMAAAEEKRQIGFLKRKQAKNANRSRHHSIRIVARDKHDVPARDVKVRQEWRKSSKPFQPPKTWTGSIKRAIAYEVYPDGQGFRLKAEPRKGGNMFIYPILEYGGRVSNARYKHGNLIGYQVVSERSETERRDGTTQKFSHRRVSLRRKYENPKDIRIQPRPFFEPGKEYIEERVQEVFGEKNVLQPFF